MYADWVGTSRIERRNLTIRTRNRIPQTARLKSSNTVDMSRPLFLRRNAVGDVGYPLEKAFDPGQLQRHD